MMRPSTFFFLTRRGVRNLGKHWAMTIACIASLSVCMTLNIFASLAEVNVGSMVAYLGSQNETVVYLDPECDDATAAQVGETLSAMPGISRVQYVSKQDVLDTFFVTTLWKDHKVNRGDKNCSFYVDDIMPFKICCEGTKIRNNPAVTYVLHKAEIGRGNQIPLWLLGFLY